jgi:Ala-tRNA(Pro) deacylase
MSWVSKVKEAAMAAAKLKSFLDEHGIKYSLIAHSPAFTAQEVAESAHIPGREVAKTVIVHVNDGFAMVVEPASRRVNLGRLKQAIGADRVSLAEETELNRLFPDCELGAMPPFGNLYGMDVYVAPELGEDEEIAFNAGTHTELVRMRYKDFEALVKPKVVTT